MVKCPHWTLVVYLHTQKPHSTKDRCFIPIFFHVVIWKFPPSFCVFGRFVAWTYLLSQQLDFSGWKSDTQIMKVVNSLLKNIIHTKYLKIQLTKPTCLFGNVKLLQQNTGKPYNDRDRIKLKHHIGGWCFNILFFHHIFRIKKRSPNCFNIIDHVSTNVQPKIKEGYQPTLNQRLYHVN